MIRITSLYKSFPAPKNDEKQSPAGKMVLADINLTIDGPVILTGPSGIGKTTLLRILMGLEMPDAGSVEGIEPARIAAVFQEDRLCPALTAAENITLTGRGVTKEEAVRELRLFGFDEKDLATKASKLSGGQCRRAALLRALLCRKTGLLLLDEPFTGMDPSLTEKACETVSRLTAGRDTLLATHNTAAIGLLGWRIYALGA